MVETNEDILEAATSRILREGNTYPGGTMRLTYFKARQLARAALDMPGPIQEIERSLI